MAGSELSAVVEKPNAQVALASLREEGAYDDDRSVYECGDETVAIPVTRYPTDTDVIEVVRESGERRLRTLADHLRDRGWTEEEVEQAPGSWAVLGTVVLVDLDDVPRPADVGDALLSLHGQADTVLARAGIDGPHREPTVSAIAGEGDTETVHTEHGTTYAMDLAEVMFAPGNKAERARMGEIVEAGEYVLDAFAGIGYFALPMARAGATVTAVERNPVAFEYLLENVVRNDVTDRIHAYRGDNREVVPGLAGAGSEGGDRDERGSGDEPSAGAERSERDELSDGARERFDRAVMGHYEAWESLDAVLPALRAGGTVHLHEATPSALVPDRPVERLEDAASSVGRSVEVLDVRMVKGYSEGVDHVAVDATVE